MKLLYAPWRTTYVKETHDQKEHDNKTADQCVFCRQFAACNDQQHFIIRRFSHCVVMLNLFPYTAGHLLIVPLNHYMHLHQMNAQERSQLIELANGAVTILKEQCKTDGTNIGINIEKAAGGAIPDHLHMHIVPRWQADTNFLPIVAQTKVISRDLMQLYEQLKPSFESLEL